MQTQAMRVYQITFTGRDAKGVIPMFTRVKAMTGKGAIKAFIERYKPVQGWFLGDPEDITDNVKKEAEEAESKAQRWIKQGNPCFIQAAEIAATTFAAYSN